MLDPKSVEIEKVLLLLLMQVGLIIAAARVMGLVARRLGQPEVIGEILAGSRREGFPNAHERSKLKIAAAQTSLACREMRELSDRRPPEDQRANPPSAQALAESAFDRLLYGSHPYGHMAIGTTATLGALELTVKP